MELKQEFSLAGFKPSRPDDVACSECGTALSDLPTRYPNRSNPYMTGGGPAGPYVCSVCLDAWNAPEAVRERALRGRK